MLIDPCTEAIRMCGLFLSSLPRSLGSTCLNNSYNWAAQTVGREAGHRDQKSAVRYTSLPSSAEPVAFHLELLGDGRQGNNQHRNGAFTFTQDDPSDLGRELKKRPHILIASVEFLSSTEVQGSMSKFPTVEFLTRWGTRSVIVASHLGTGRLWSTLLTSARFFCRFCSCSEL